MADRLTDDSVFRLGVVAGVLAYLAGVAVVFTLERSGLYSRSGVWGREFALADYLLVHAGAHVPYWSGGLRTELLPVTGALVLLLAVAGATLANSVSEGAESGFRAGGAVILGYLPATVVGGLYVVVTMDAVTVVQMVAPVLLAGGVIPLLFGGLGGALAGFRVLVR